MRDMRAVVRGRVRRLGLSREAFKFVKKVRSPLELSRSSFWPKRDNVDIELDIDLDMIPPSGRWSAG